MRDGLAVRDLRRRGVQQEQQGQANVEPARCGRWRAWYFLGQRQRRAEAEAKAGEGCARSMAVTRCQEPTLLHLYLAKTCTCCGLLCQKQLKALTPCTFQRVNRHTALPQTTHAPTPLTFQRAC